jgi:hypothetical protein
LGKDFPDPITTGDQVRERTAITSGAKSLIDKVIKDVARRGATWILPWEQRQLGLQIFSDQYWHITTQWTDSITLASGATRQEDSMAEDKRSQEISAMRAGSSSSICDPS